MADFKKYWPKLVEFEGSAFENVPGDNGGPTKYGVTLAEWKAKGYDKDGDKDVDVDDLKMVTSEDAAKIAKGHYWDKLKADQINNQVIAEFLVDFAYNCGVGISAKKLQEVLGVTQDSVIGPVTIAKLNAYDQGKLFTELKLKRENYYNAIVANNPSQRKFLKGWLNHNNSFKFVA